MTRHNATDKSGCYAYTTFDLLHGETAEIYAVCTPHVSLQ